MAQLSTLGALASMKLVRTRLVISWLLFAAFLAAFWLHFYTVACLALFPAIVIVRLHIPTPKLSTLERRVSWVFAVIFITSIFPVLMGPYLFPPAVVLIGKILGTILVFAYGIFTDYSKLRQLHEPSA